VCLSIHDVCRTVCPLLGPLTIPSSFRELTPNEKEAETLQEEGDEDPPSEPDGVTSMESVKADVGYRSLKDIFSGRTATPPPEAVVCPVSMLSADKKTALTEELYQIFHSISVESPRTVSQEKFDSLVAAVSTKGGEADEDKWVGWARASYEKRVRDLSRNSKQHYCQVCCVLYDPQDHGHVLSGHLKMNPN
jgi:hypothetical protein